MSSICDAGSKQFDAARGLDLSVHSERREEKMGKKTKKPGKGKEKTERKTARAEEKKARRETKKLSPEDDIDAILVCFCYSLVYLRSHFHFTFTK